jgi:hypothetical protein
MLPYDPASGKFGNTVVALTAKNFRLQDTFTPANREYLNKTDLNLGSANPQPNPICKQASSRFGEDWCAIVAAVPKKLTYAGGASATPLYDVSLEYLLSIAGNKMYFLGLTKEIGYDYVLVEVSKDASSWTVLKLMSPEAGMGLCQKEADGVQADECWRRIALRRVAGKDEMRFDDWGISWSVSSGDCSPSGRK